MKLHKYSLAILGAYLVFSLGLLVTCMIIIREVKGVMGTTEQLYVHPFAVRSAALEAKLHISAIRDAITYSVLSQSISRAQDARRSDVFFDERFGRALDTVKRNYLGPAEDVARAGELYETWKRVRRGILDAAQAGDFERAREMVLDAGTPAYVDLRALLDKISEFAGTKAAQFIAEAGNLSRRAIMVVYATILMGFAASFSSGLFIVRRVEKVMAENQRLLVHRATHDTLTGLPNRALLTDRLDQALKLAKRGQTLVGVIFVDLDGFKSINDTLGHDAGDELLVLAASRLTGALRESDTVARLGGDEFVAVITGAKNRDEIDVVAAKLAARLSVQATLSKATVLVRGSLGVAVFPDDGEDAAALLALADAAMYRDKSKSRPASDAALFPARDV